MAERKAFLINPKHQCRVPSVENMIVVPINKKNRDCYEYPSLFYFTKTKIIRKMVERKAFLANPKQ